jgi:hypothetical protein
VFALRTCSFTIEKGQSRQRFRRNALIFSKEHGMDGKNRITKHMDDTIVTILHSVGEFALLAAFSAAVPLIVYVDCRILRNEVSELSLTEISQESLLFFSAILFFIEAYRRPASRCFFLLVGGFFTCMLIRELDDLFDMIQPGFWVNPAVITVIAVTTFAAFHRETILPAAADFAKTKSFIYLIVGLSVVMVFSRIFGSGKLLWIAVMGSDYKSMYKNVIQEGLELFGYGFIYYGSQLLRYEQYS